MTRSWTGSLIMPIYDDWEERFPKLNLIDSVGNQMDHVAGAFLCCLSMANAIVETGMVQFYSSPELGVNVCEECLPGSIRHGIRFPAFNVFEGDGHQSLTSRALNFNPAVFPPCDQLSTFTANIFGHLFRCPMWTGILGIVASHHMYCLPCPIMWRSPSILNALSSNPTSPSQCIDDVMFIPMS